MKNKQKWDDIAYKIIKLEIILSNEICEVRIEELTEKILKLEEYKQGLIHTALDKIPIKESTLKYMFDEDLGESYDEY